MPHLSVSRSSNCSPFWLICVLLGLSAAHAHAKDVLSVPQQVSLSADMYTQQLSISWFGGAASTFDLMILRTELNETVVYETVSATVNQESGRHQWNWTSVEPLECTSLSIKIRSRDGQTTSEWSNTQILQGNDLPSNAKFQAYPQDRIVPVGANTTFCCIVEEGKKFGSIHYGSTVVNATRLSRRSYATTVVNQGPSSKTGTNIICYDDPKRKLTGAVVFVGYPPLPSDFVCETNDLTSAVCQWNKGRDTNLYGKRGTRYLLNNRACTLSRLPEKQMECRVAQWEGNWTLVAENTLGQYSLTDSAELSHRVHPVAPGKLNCIIQAWNATLLWQWKYDSYSSLALVCQVELTCLGYKIKRTFSGVGLRSVALSDLHPDEDYSVQVRCGAQKNFWKWGNWSEPLSFKTKTYVPDAPDVWMWMNKDYTGQVIWKPLTRTQSHGLITGYEVTLWSPGEKLQHTKTVSADTSAVPINLTQITTLSGGNKLTATVIAKNADGVSQPTSVLIPLHLTDVEPLAVSRAVYTERGFPLFWQSDANATCGYVVEWCDATCKRDCPVEWIKVAAESTNVSIESDNFQPGVRYNISLYSCSSEAPELLQRCPGAVRGQPINVNGPGSSQSPENMQQMKKLMEQELKSDKYKSTNNKGYVFTLMPLYAIGVGVFAAYKFLKIKSADDQAQKDKFAKGAKKSVEAENQLNELEQRLAQTERMLNSILTQLDPLTNCVKSVAQEQKNEIMSQLQTIRYLMKKRGMDCPPLNINESSCERNLDELIESLGASDSTLAVGASLEDKRSSPGAAEASEKVYQKSSEAKDEAATEGEEMKELVPEESDAEAEEEGNAGKEEGDDKEEEEEGSEELMPSLEDSYETNIEEVGAEQPVSGLRRRNRPD